MIDALLWFTMYDKKLLKAMDDAKLEAAYNRLSVGEGEREG